MVWRCACDFDIILKFIFCHIFRNLNLVIFEARIVPSVYILDTLVGATSPTVLWPIFFKLYMCFCHGRKLCIWFGYNPQIKFCHSFRILNVVIFQSWLLLKYMDSGYLVCAIPPAVLCQSFSNCTGVFIMVWRYACGLDIIIRSISFCIDISFNLTNYKVGGHKFTDFASYCLIITEKKISVCATASK